MGSIVQVVVSAQQEALGCSFLVLHGTGGVMCTCNPNTSLGCTVGMMLAWATGDPVSKPTKQSTL